MSNLQTDLDAQLMADMRVLWNRIACERVDRYAHRHSRRHDATFYSAGAEACDQIMRNLRLRPDKSLNVLEIGCGPGRLSQRLADIFGSLVAADISPNMIWLADRALAGSERASTALLPGNGSLPFPDSSFDLVISVQTMEHIPSLDFQERYLAEAHRVLRMGGSAYMEYSRKTAFALLMLKLRSRLYMPVTGDKEILRDRAWKGMPISRARLTNLCLPDSVLTIKPDRVVHQWAVLRK